MIKMSFFCKVNSENDKRKSNIRKMLVTRGTFGKPRIMKLILNILLVLREGCKSGLLTNNNNKRRY